MAYNYNRNCPPCGRPPYRDPWGPPPPPGNNRPPYPGPWGPPPPGAGRPPYQRPWGPPPPPGNGRPPYPDHRRMSSEAREMPRLCPSGRVCETEKTAESEDLYMADMQEPGQMEEDWLYMKQLYPNTARKLMTYIEDAADRLEYENSLMFDAYPDRIAVEQVVKEIIAVVQENEPTLLVMPESENGQNDDQTWSSCVEEIIQMMLLGEMHHRRWRYQQMNRRNY